MRVFDFFAAVTAGYFAETFGSGSFLRVNRGRGSSCRSCGGIVLARFNARAILFNENLRLF